MFLPRNIANPCFKPTLKSSAFIQALGELSMQGVGFTFMVQGTFLFVRFLDGAGPQHAHKIPLHSALIRSIRFQLQGYSCFPPGVSKEFSLPLQCTIGQVDAGFFSILL